MDLFSYVLDHDYGFAPNPFFGVCTLATCKPKIRDRASVGDYVMGTGCAKRNRSGRLVYMMRIDEITTYDDYWADERFRRKRPTVGRGTAHAFGDNIYHKKDGAWQQASSFHSLPDGRPNPLNRDHDTGSERVLIGREFVYFGGVRDPWCPSASETGTVPMSVRGALTKRHFPDDMTDAVVAWAMGLGQGRLGAPADWVRLPAVAR